MLKHCVMVSCTLAIVTTPLLAQGRPDTRKMSCAQVQSLIEQRRAVVLTTGQHTYDRYVAGPRWCDHPSIPVNVDVQTKDTHRCVVKNCQNVPLDDFFRRW